MKPADVPAPITHTLAFPVTGADGETVSVVSLRRCTAGDLRITDGVKGEVSQAIALIAQISGLDRETIAKLGLDDFHALTNIMETGKAADPAT